MPGVWSPPFEWHPLSDMAAMGRLESVLEEWRGTPYESGQCMKGLGADCIGTVFPIIDELDGRVRADMPALPADTAMHSRSTALRALRDLLARYAPVSRVVPVDGVYHVEPGDVVGTGMPGGGPGHVQIVGARRNELWHALPASGFHQGGFGLLDEQVLHAVYRIEDKSRWGWPC